jgi:hypothetical protein
MNFLTRVPFDLNGPLTIAILLSPAVRDAAIILERSTTDVHCAYVSGREIARHPPPLGPVMVGGVSGLPTKFAGAPYQASEGNVLRQRCDARGFTLPPIEIIARRKVAPAFEATEGERKNGPSTPVQSYGCLRSSRVVVLRVFST